MADIIVSCRPLQPIGTSSTYAMKVASWQISNNVICGSDVVCFYAIESSEVSVLRGELKDFEKELPAGTKAIYPPL